MTAAFREFLSLRSARVMIEERELLSLKEKGRGTLLLPSKPNPRYDFDVFANGQCVRVHVLRTTAEKAWFRVDVRVVP